MHQIDAGHLHPGATVLDGVTPRRLAAVHVGPQSVFLVFDHRDGSPGRTRECARDQTLLLTTEHKVSWTVHHQQRDPRTGRGHGAVHTARIANTGAVTAHWAYTAAHQVVTRLVEEHTVITSTPLTLQQLPGPGQATAAAPPSGSRFFHLLRGPAVLSTGDAVREHLQRLQNEHDQRHRPQWRPDSEHNPDIYQCAACAPGPLDLVLFEVVIERTFYDITPNQLPDFAYELGQAAAFERITVAARLGAVPATTRGCRRPDPYGAEMTHRPFLPEDFEDADCEECGAPAGEYCRPGCGSGYPAAYATTPPPAAEGPAEA